MNKSSTTGSLPEIFFYIPEGPWQGSIPGSPEEYWMNIESKRGDRHYGRYSWTLKTYLYLQRSGFICSLCDTIPEHGVLVSHRDFLAGLTEQPSEYLTLVCIKADREPLTNADLHIIQNRKDPITRSREWQGRYYFLHYWPQACLVPRDPNRGTRIKNVAYVGRSWNLDPELQKTEWRNTLHALGMNWYMPPPEMWNDYSQVDVIVAVRSLQPEESFDTKPASKLINAWTAGVPAILGAESAYQTERKNELDYFEVVSIEQAIESLRTLKENFSLYMDMVNNGKERSVEFREKNIVQEWTRFFSKLRSV